MKLKLKRRFLLLPTLLLGTVLTAACTDNDQTTSNKSNKKPSDQTASNVNSPDKAKDNNEQNSETGKQELNKTSSSDSNSISAKSEPESSPMSKPGSTNSNRSPQTGTAQSADGMQSVPNQSTGHAQKTEIHSEDSSSMSGTTNKDGQAAQHGGGVEQASEKTKGDSAGESSGGGSHPVAPEGPKPHTEDTAEHPVTEAKS